MVETVQKANFFLQFFSIGRGFLGHHVISIPKALHSDVLLLEPCLVDGRKPTASYFKLSLGL